MRWKDTGPVLLLGAGPGLATSGLVYLASHLRRHGVEAYARPLDTAPDLREIERRLHILLDRVRPRWVGVSVKWFLHLNRGLHIARVVKAHDPSIRVVFGGDTASLYYRELLELDCVDYVVRGDGEVPLLSIVRGIDHPNAAHRAGATGPLLKLSGAYMQDRDSDDNFLSDLDEIFLCESDGYYLPPFVVGGKGCSQACLYCGGARSAQLENFGRRRSFMRPSELVRRDIEALRSRAYCLVYDFSDHPLSDPTESLRALWAGMDFSKAGILYYAWRVPPKDFVAMLAETYESVTLGLDFGCFSQAQRQRLIREHLLKPLPDDAEFVDVVRECARYPNVRVRVSGVAGLPLQEPEDLEAERRLMETLLEFDIVEDVLFDRVHAQPAAPVLERAGEFGLEPPPRSFADFLSWSTERAPNGEYVPPLLRYATDEPGSERDRNRQVDAAFHDTKQLIARGMRARTPDAGRFSEFADVAEQRFVRAAKSRVLNRYRLRDWWLDFERPASATDLDEEMARIVVGHVWCEEFGAISVSAITADYVLSAFDRPTSGASALQAVRAQNASISEEVLRSIIQFFYQREVLLPVD